MLTLVVLLALAYFAYSGARRGAALQMVHTVGYALSFVFAMALCRTLGSKLTLLVPYPSATDQGQFAFFTNHNGVTFDDAFYRGVAFLLVLSLGWGLTRVISLWFNNLTYQEIDAKRSAWVGGAINVVIGYIFIALILMVLALIPLSGIQNMLSGSLIGKMMIKFSPGLVQMVDTLWL